MYHHLQGCPYYLSPPPSLSLFCSSVEVPIRMEGSRGSLSSNYHNGDLMLYYCGIRAPLSTSLTEKNPGMRFYDCSNYKKNVVCSFVGIIHQHAKEGRTFGNIC